MECNTTEYLPEHILAGINLRVINRLGLYSDCTPKNNTDVIKSCRLIEQDILQVYSVIEDSMNRMKANLGKGYRYRHFLTSIFILLYYQHHNEKNYQLLVFPQLENHMGDFAKEPFLTSEIDKMREENAQVQSCYKDTDIKRKDSNSLEVDNIIINKLRNENKILKSILEEYTGEKETGTRQVYFNTSQIAIALYFLADAKDVRILDNQKAWAILMSKIVRRNCQNIRKSLGELNSDMLSLKKDAIIVAQAYDSVEPRIADKIRKNFDIVVTTQE